MVSPSFVCGDRFTSSFGRAVVTSSTCFDTVRCVFVRLCLCFVYFVFVFVCTCCMLSSVLFLLVVCIRCCVCLYVFEDHNPYGVVFVLLCVYAWRDGIMGNSRCVALYCHIYCLILDCLLFIPHCDLSHGKFATLSEILPCTLFHITSCISTVRSHMYAIATLSEVACSVFVHEM